MPSGDERETVEERPKSGDDKDDAGVGHESGEFLGEFEGLKIRGVLKDSGNPVLEIHGEDGMAAVEANKESVEGFTEAAAEIQSAIDEREGVL